MTANVHALQSRLRASRCFRLLLGVGITGLVVPIVGLAVASAIVGLYDSKILPGVRVGSADIGGVSLPDARHHVAERYAELAVGLVTIETPTGPAIITFKEIGRGPNVETAVAAAAAVGRSDNPMDRILGLVAKGRTVTDASGKVIHQDAFRSHYSKVDGLLQIGAPD